LRRIPFPSWLLSRPGSETQYRWVLRPLFFKLGVELTKTESNIDGGSSALENTECLDDGRRHAVLGLVDLEVLEGSLSLGAPVAVGGDLDLAKGVALGSCRRHSDGSAVDGSGKSQASRRAARSLKSLLRGSVTCEGRSSAGRPRQRLCESRGRSACRYSSEHDGLVIWFDAERKATRRKRREEKRRRRRDQLGLFDWGVRRTIWQLRIFLQEVLSRLPENNLLTVNRRRLRPVGTCRLSKKKGAVSVSSGYFSVP
jgi:hypothetical protein